MLSIRMAVLDDSSELLDIYAPYVLNTAVTFEYDVPSQKDFAGRIAETLEKFPYLVAEIEGKIVGYAYASDFHERAAYGWSAETAIYVRNGMSGQGIGRALYTRLESILSRQNITNVNACITYPNPASIGFHEAMGYKTAAHFTNCGYKLGRWWDMIWMEKFIGEHKSPPAPVIPIGKIEV